MRHFATTIIFFSITLVLSRAGADTQSDVNAAVFEAEAMFEFGDYSGAADAYRKAYKLGGNWEILLDIAKCESAAKRWGLALEAYQQYLSKGGDKITMMRRNEVVSEIKIVESMVGFLKIEAPDGTKVTVDNVERGTTPISGDLAVEADVEHKVTLGKGAPQKVSVGWGLTALVKQKPAGEEIEEGESLASFEESTDTSEKKSKPLLKLTGLIAALSGSAVLLGGGVTGAIALSYNKKLNDACYSGICGPEQSEMLDSRDKLSTATNVLLIAGGTILTGGIVLLAIAPKETKESDSLAFKGGAGPDMAFAAVEWRF